jgi:hypothetical protein
LLCFHHPWSFPSTTVNYTFILAITTTLGVIYLFFSPSLGVTPSSSPLLAPPPPSHFDFKTRPTVYQYLLVVLSLLFLSL